MEIQVCDITKTFADRTVLNQYNACFDNQVINCIMGESGVGKTTLLRIIMGLEEADIGQILGVQDKKVRMVFQEDRLLENNTVLDNLLFVMNGKKKENLECIQKACRQVGLSKCLSQNVKELSGGMKRRVVLVRAFVCDFDILLLDEPLKGLDKDTKKKVAAYMLDEVKKRQEHRKEAPIIIMVTHDSEDVNLVKGKVFYL